MSSKYITFDPALYEKNALVNHLTKQSKNQSERIMVGVRRRIHQSIILFSHHQPSPTTFLLMYKPSHTFIIFTPISSLYSFCKLLDSMSSRKPVFTRFQEVSR